MKRLLDSILADPRYLEGIEWGDPRPGHGEGAIKNHIADLKWNLELLDREDYVTSDQEDKLLILIHVHDTFKKWSVEQCPIVHPQSHASLATQFLKRKGVQDKDILTICQYHDEWWAIYNRQKRKGMDERCQTRLNALIERVDDWQLYVLFAVIDSCTPHKGMEAILWFLTEVGADAEMVDLCIG